MKKIIQYIGLALLVAVIYLGTRAYIALDDAEVFKTPVYETTPPQLPAELSAPAVLVFSKTNSFRHHGAIAAANALFKELAEYHQLAIFFTENGAVHNATQLAKFKVIIWNNNTGDVLTTEQRAALKHYIENGGHWLGIHGAGGSREYSWQWYPQCLLRATFVGHTLFPQFQTGVLDIEDRNHPATRHLPARWQWFDEWYSFEQSPRSRGVHVLASLDESSYQPRLDHLLMDNDHPLIWTHNVGQGTVFYTALGHNGSAYQQPEYRRLLENTLLWLIEK